MTPDSSRVFMFMYTKVAGEKNVTLVYFLIFKLRIKKMY